MLFWLPKGLILSDPLVSFLYTPWYELIFEEKLYHKNIGSFTIEEGVNGLHDPSKVKISILKAQCFHQSRKRWDYPITLHHHIENLYKMVFTCFMMHFLLKSEEYLKPRPTGPSMYFYSSPSMYFYPCFISIFLSYFCSDFV